MQGNGSVSGKGKDAQGYGIVDALVAQSWSAQSWCEQGTVARKAQPTLAMNMRQGRL